MLVLSRRVGQKIRIGTSIVVTLLKVDRNRARIGIEAPADVPVYRQELFDFACQRPVGPAAGQSSSASSDRRSTPRLRIGPAHGFSTTECLWGPRAV